MLNNAWPSLIWNLYDYYLRPAGAYFGTKKACEPLHIQYSYDDRSIVVVNSLPRQFQNLKASAEILDLELRKRFTRDLVIDIAPDASAKVFDIPEFQDLTTTYFIRLNLSDDSGKTISSNFYWLSTQPDILDWHKSEWYYTPTLSHADLTGLQTMPKVQLKITSSTRRKGEDNLTRVTVMNPMDYLAFFVRLRITNGIGGEEVLPVLWEDNYLTLLPGEKREITATYESTNLKNAIPVVAVDGWNIEKGSFPSRY
jgi:exo-1,4-beta-D-glucosaminidase